MTRVTDRRSRRLGVGLSLVLAAGCSDGGGGFLGSGVIDDGKEFGGNAQSVAPYRDTLTANEAYHLLQSAAFGATPEQVSEAVSKGLSATVEDLLRVRPIPTEVKALSERYEDDLPQRWLVYMIEGPNPLHEKMTLFWHDRFATSQRVLSGRDRGLGLVHWEMLRTQALGNYRTFLQELTIDPMMLIWLDGANSPKQNPNENYTREFWELFTLGRDTLYTEEDIREGARAFTGITLFREQDMNARPIYDLLNHDETPKTIFPDRASSDNYNYLSVIDLTLEQPEAAEYVARNLFTYFVHDHPSADVVRDLASTFRQASFDIAPLVRRILRSQAMFSSESRGNRILSPVEHVVGVFRTLDMHIHSEESQDAVLNRIASDLREAGHELLNPPGVEGWGENEYWLKDQSLLSRIRALGRTMEFGPDRTPGLPYQILPPTSRWDEREIRREIVEAVASVFHLELTEEEIDVYIEVLDQNGWLAFHLEDPERQPRHVFEMIRLMAMDERVLSR